MRFSGLLAKLLDVGKTELFILSVSHLIEILFVTWVTWEFSLSLSNRRILFSRRFWTLDRQ